MNGFVPSRTEAKVQLGNDLSNQMSLANSPPPPKKKITTNKNKNKQSKQNKKHCANTASKFQNNFIPKYV